MKMKISMFGLSLIFCGGLVFAGDSSSNRNDQTVRLGQKSGKHLMYSTSTPSVLELPGPNWTFGLTSGSGKYNYSYTDYNSTSGVYLTKTQSINFSTMEATARLYIGNSFSIPLAYAYYKISYPDWVYSGVTYDIDYKITQLNYGIGNEWTYDWGAYLGIDWYQSGIKLSDKTKVTLKSGKETSTTRQKATTTSTDIKAFAGELILTLGFGF